MSEPLLPGQTLRAEWDDETDTIEAIGRLSGPAGTVGLQFDDLVVDLDVADPGWVATIEIPDASAPGRLERAGRVLDLLVGDGTGDGLRSTFEAPGHGVVLMPHPDFQFVPRHLDVAEHAEPTTFAPFTVALDLAHADAAWTARSRAGERSALRLCDRDDVRPARAHDVAESRNDVGTGHVDRGR